LRCFFSCDGGAQAQVMLQAFVSSAESISHCQLMLDNSKQHPALLLAANRFSSV
jgi:hypothetical protein